MIDYHPVVQQIKMLLEQNKFWFETFEHEPVRTSEEAAKIRHGYSLHQGAKALIVQVKLRGFPPVASRKTGFCGAEPRTVPPIGAGAWVKKNETDKTFVMLVIPGGCRFDGRKVKNALKIREIRFANEQEVQDMTNGVLVGGVPPFGNVFGLRTYVDAAVLQNEKIIFNAGDRRFSIAMFSKDWLTLVKPEVVVLV